MKPPDLDWGARMTPAEEKWCWEQIWSDLRSNTAGECADNFRAAQIWKGSHRRRFRKIEANGCCGSANWVAKRWNPDKERWDIYLLGYNFGH